MKLLGENLHKGIEILAMRCSLFRIGTYYIANCKVCINLTILEVKAGLQIFHEIMTISQ